MSAHGRRRRTATRASVACGARRRGPACVQTPAAAGAAAHWFSPARYASVQECIRILPVKLPYSKLLIAGVTGSVDSP
ncbi:hypothetical protein EVAR_33747_1 [Eumeta japonica]|uniref:Uncharacterized protein n=1 Tax=Eumeta variegata TaxID=151549 RepID=A0A4C1VRK3_EUMVA|nr:hypothetical protein EVAR_33747_1 [Eumeta japonica]